MMDNHTDTMQPGFYLMDCMDAMRRFPDGFFDLAVVDPPYGIGADRFNNGHGFKDHSYGSTAYNLRRQRLNGGAGKLKNRVLNKSDCSWDSQRPQAEYFKELMRVSKNQIIWGGNYFPLPPTRCVLVWDKLQPWDNFSQVEIAWTSYDKPAALFRMNNCYSGKIHPTQKPVQLYEWILNKFAEPGYKVLDTHVGSASSLIAFHRAGLEYWGFEIDEEYYRTASQRLNNEKSQMNMFGAEMQKKQDEISRNLSFFDDF